MTMGNGIERELIAAVARLEGAGKAQHEEQMRENQRVGRELIRLTTLGEERERSQVERENVFQSLLATINNWQLTHPSDPGAHTEIREMGLQNAMELQKLLKAMTEMTKRVDTWEAEARGKSYVFGIQYKGLTIGMAIIGTVTATLAALNVI